jgi:hypothetical protein
MAETLYNTLQLWVIATRVTFASKQPLSLRFFSLFCNRLKPAVSLEALTGKNFELKA